MPVTTTLSDMIISDLRRCTQELNAAQKLVKVPMTSLATASQIYNTIGYAAVCMEALLWWIDEGEQEAQEQEDNP